MTSPTQEIERKWLVREHPKLKRLKHERIVQGYLAISSDGAEVRVRRMGDKCFETVKSQGAPFSTSNTLVDQLACGLRISDSPTSDKPHKKSQTRMLPTWGLMGLVGPVLVAA